MFLEARLHLTVIKTKQKGATCACVVPYKVLFKAGKAATLHCTQLRGTFKTSANHQLVLVSTICCGLLLIGEVRLYMCLHPPHFVAGVESSDW